MSDPARALGATPASVSRELTVHACFFYSDFLPAVCLFSGATDRLNRVKIEVVFNGQATGGPSMAVAREKWAAVIWPRARRSAFYFWRLRHGVRDLCLVTALGVATLGAIFFPATYGMEVRAHDFSGWLTLLAVFVCLFAGLLGLRWWLGRNQLAFRAEEAQHQVTVVFPPQLQPVRDQYAEAWASFLDAGCPIPARFIDHDDGWEDAAAGFDQAGPT